MKNSLVLILAVFSLALTGCSKDEPFTLVTDLIMSGSNGEAIVIVNPQDKAAFCAGTAALQLKLTGQEKYYPQGSSSGKYRGFFTDPNVTQTQYSNDTRIEPCSMFSVQFEHTDDLNQVYDAHLGVMDGQCKIKLKHGITFGRASGYVSHPRMSQAYRFNIACP